MSSLKARDVSSASSGGSDGVDPSHLCALDGA